VDEQINQTKPIIWQPPTRFGHLCGHLQARKNKNTNTIIMCLNHPNLKSYNLA